MAEFNILDYGAIGDGVTNDRAAIQAAVDAASAAGGGIVRVPAGVFAIGPDGATATYAGIQLPSNISLIGEGMGVSTIKVMDGASALPGASSMMTGIVRTPVGVETTNVLVEGLTLDGNRDNTTGKVDGFFCGTIPGAGTAASDITVRGVEVKDCSGYGIDPHEQTIRLTLEDNVSHGNGLDGFTLDYQIDAVVTGNIAYDNDRHGFNIVTSSNNILIEGNESYDNGSSGMVVQRGSENRPVPFDIEIRDNIIRDNAKEGILIKMADGVTVEDNTISGNGKQGIYVSGATNTVIDGNEIFNNSQASNGYYGEVQLAPYDDPLFGATYPIANNSVTNNTIYADGVIRAGWGIYQNTSYTESHFSGNTITGMVKAPSVTPPQQMQVLPDLDAAADAAFSYVLPALSFYDADAGDNLTYTATLVGGGALPSWLAFNAATRTFSGTPTDGDIGTLAIVVTAFDRAGRAESDVLDLVVSLEGGNPAPTLENPIPDVPGLIEDSPFTFTIPAGTFADPGDTITYHAVLADGTPLPSWLNFDASTQTFSGSPDNASVGNLEILVIATDTDGGNVSDSFVFSIANTDDAPTVTNPIDDQTVLTGTAFNYIFPEDSITDVDVGDKLTFTATLANGDPLPDWLHFDPAARRFSGIADGDDLGLIEVRVTATDLDGASVSDVFEITITDTPPVLPVFDVMDYGAIGDGVADDRGAIQAAADAAFAAGGGIVKLPAGTFALGISDEATYAGIQLRSNVSLIGEGMGETVIKVMDGAEPFNSGSTSLMTGIVRTPFNEVTVNVTISDLTLDGNRANTTGKVDGFFTGTAPGSAASSSDITVARVEIKDASGYGFDPHEITTRLNLIDNVAHGNGLDGFTLDYLVDSVVSGNISYDNDRHGFNVVTQTRNTTLENNQAYDNGGNGIIVQRGSEDMPSPNNIIIRDNTLTNNGAEGIFIRMSHDITIEGNTITGSGRHGISLSGSSNVTIENNDILNSSQASNGTYNGVNIATYPDAVTGTTYGVDGNQIHGNTIVDDGAIRAGYGIRQTASTVGSHFDGNTIAGQTKAASVTPPQLDHPLVDAATPTSVPFTYAVAVDAFSDIDVNERLTYSATLANGAPLPSWLVFDAVTRTFSGTAPEGSDGLIELKVIASDKQGKFESDIFQLTIGDNVAPTVANPLLDVPAFDQGTPFTYTVPANTFADADVGDVLTYSAMLASGAPLPAWLSFDPVTGTFSGTPGTGSGGDYDIRVTATDLGGASVSDDFHIAVVANPLPTLVTPVADQPALVEGAAFSFAVPAGSFADAGDTLTYSATLADGSALPIWLIFDPLTQTFSGTPPQAGVGATTVRVIATDTGLNAIFDDFVLTVAEVAMAPVVAVPIVDQTGTEGAAFSFAVPAGTFVEEDPGDSITYTARLAGGAALPAWLAFNALTQTFTGTVPSAAVGALTIEVVATDTTGRSVADAFVLTLNGGGSVLTGDELGNTIDGTALGDTISGLGGADHLNGLAGNDILNGGEGDDVLDGGTGADRMTGGAGNDTYYVDNAGDVVTETSSAHGVDIVYSSVHFVAPTNVENVTLTGSANLKATGNGQANILIGNSGNNALDGLGGADTMIGGLGNDTYYVSTSGDTVVENAGEGNDVVISTAGYTLTANVERLILAGTATAGTGNELDNTITGNAENNRLYGLDGHDKLNGLVGNDTLEGAAGDDTLNGGVGADLMRGGMGNDIYYVDDIGDVVQELAGQGTDRVNAYINYTLTANVENLYLYGSALQVSGNALANTIGGSAKGNTIYGLDGDDLLLGHGGNDNLFGGLNNDRLYGGEGVDVLQGDEGNDRLYGEEGMDTLIGGNGDDFLWGGADRDTFTGGLGADSFVFGNGDFRGAKINDAERILDFSRIQGDKVDMSRMDANTAGGTSNDAFHFVGSGAFTGTAGELRYQHNADGNTYVYGDTDGDKVADLAIRFDGQIDLIATDFIL